MVEPLVTEPVFISHGSDDANWARELAVALRNAGVPAWLDTLDIRPGDRWLDQTEDALRNARTLLVLLTPSSVHSPQLFFEFGAALADQKTIIPVLSNDMRIEDLPPALRQFRWVKASSAHEAAAEIAQALGARPLQELAVQ